MSATDSLETPDSQSHDEVLADLSENMLFHSTAMDDRELPDSQSGSEALSDLSSDIVVYEAVANTCEIPDSQSDNEVSGDLSRDAVTQPREPGSWDPIRTREDTVHQVQSGMVAVIL